jgi:hypothetical protein
VDTIPTKIKMNFSQILAACRLDKRFRDEFIANPRMVLDVFEVDFHPESELKVIEVPFNTITIGIFPMVEASNEPK